MQHDDGDNGNSGVIGVAIAPLGYGNTNDKLVPVDGELCAAAVGGKAEVRINAMNRRQSHRLAGRTICVVRRCWHVRLGQESGRGWSTMIATAIDPQPTIHG